MNTSAAHGLVGQAVRRLCGVVDGEPLEVRRARLVQRLTRYLPPEQHKDVTEFLGELCAIPFPGEDSPRLRAAREDPHLMNAQVTRALVTWLKAECAQSPVLLMLEDLHWSDGPSIQLMDEVLRELAEHPLMVLALARPEVKELFPRAVGPERAGGAVEGTEPEGQHPAGARGARAPGARGRGGPAGGAGGRQRPVPGGADPQRGRGARRGAPRARCWPCSSPACSAWSRRPGAWCWRPASSAAPSGRGSPGVAGARLVLRDAGRAG